MISIIRKEITIETKEKQISEKEIKEESNKDKRVDKAALVKGRMKKKKGVKKCNKSTSNNINT